MKTLDIENVQERAIEAVSLLTTMSLKIPQPLTILANLKEVESRIEEGYSILEITTSLKLDVTATSFSSAWYRATQVKMTDVPRKRRGRTNLLAKGYTEAQIKDIMEATA